MAYDEALASRIRELLAGEAGITEMKMFGGLAFLVDRHMAVAAGGDGIMLRVDAETEDQLLDRDGIEQVIMRGRPMSGWLDADEDAVADDERLRELVELALAHARTLPPKV